MPEMVPNYEFWAGIPSLVKVTTQLSSDDFQKADPKVISHSGRLEAWCDKPVRKNSKTKVISHAAYLHSVQYYTVPHATFLFYLYVAWWRHGVLVVSALDFRSGGRWFEPGLCRRVVSLDKKLNSKLSLNHTQVYK